MAAATKDNFLKKMLIISGIATGVFLVIAIVAAVVGASNPYNQETLMIWSAVSYLFWVLFSASLGVLICSAIVKCGCNCCNGFTIFFTICGILGSIIFVVVFIANSFAYTAASSDLTNDFMVDYIIDIKDKLYAYSEMNEAYLEVYKKFSIDNNCCGIASYDDAYGKNTMFASSACDNASASTTPCIIPIAKISSPIYIITAGFYTTCAILAIVACIIYILYTVMACMYCCKKEDKKFGGYPNGMNA
ncbi:hypothetical protein WA158_000475 [Blastocystis sp. Blastoise]